MDGQSLAAGDEFCLIVPGFGDDAAEAWLAMVLVGERGGGRDKRGEGNGKQCLHGEAPFVGKFAGFQNVSP
jgi:hypothetical protein